LRFSEVKPSYSPDVRLSSAFHTPRDGVMQLFVRAVVIALLATPLKAQSLISHDSITPTWARRHLIGGIDASAPGFGTTFPCVKTWPEVARALIAIYEESATTSLARADALLVLGATGQDSAYRFLVRTLDHTAENDPFRMDMIIALGNSANPPNFVYDRLNLALTAGTTADRSIATRSLSDIRSSKADSLLRKARASETSPGQVAAIDGALKRMQNTRPRTAAVCDSALFGIR
jgi:hypothetical protein